MSIINVQLSPQFIQQSTAASVSTDLPLPIEISSSHDAASAQPTREHFQRYLGNSRVFRVVDGRGSYDSDDSNHNACCTDDRLTASISVSIGTYMTHAELPLTVPQLSDSPFSTAPWSENTADGSWNVGLQPFGIYRSIFHNGAVGNYQNFYDLFSISAASSFYATSIIPRFNSDDGNCAETTFVPAECVGGYEEYRPFFVENRGYTRSYFYGISQ